MVARIILQKSITGDSFPRVLAWGLTGRPDMLGRAGRVRTAAAQNCILPDALESISTIRYLRRGPTAGFKTFSLSRFP